MSNAASTANLAYDTRDAFMADEYGPNRWAANIEELAQAGYSAEAIEWIVRSKIARWADDAELTMMEYITRYVGDAKLLTWMPRRFNSDPERNDQ